MVPGKSELQGHTKTAAHVKNVKSQKDTQSITAFGEVRNKPAVKAGVALIERKNISFTLLDSLMKTLHDVADDSKTVKKHEL